MLLELFSIPDSRLSVHRCCCCRGPSGLRSHTHRRRPIPPTVRISVSLLWRLTAWVGAPAWQGEGSLSVADFLCLTRRRGAGVCLLHKGTSPTHDLSPAEGGPPTALRIPACGSGGAQAFRHSTPETRSELTQVDLYFAFCSPFSDRGTGLVGSTSVGVSKR